MRDLLPWTDWDDYTRMQIIATWRHWHLFNDKGAPRVVKRRKVIDRTKAPPVELCEEERCELDSEDASLTADARDFLRQAWAEWLGWNKANRGG